METSTRPRNLLQVHPVNPLWDTQILREYSPARPLPVLHPEASTFFGPSLEQALPFTAGLADNFQTKLLHV